MCQRTGKPAQVQVRLRGLVQHAYTNVPYYRDLMTGAGVHPSDFRTMRDFIDGFPPTHTLHYRAVQHEEGPASLLDQRLRVENLSRDNSSGSTSVPVSVFHSPKEAAHYGAKTLSLLVRAGLRPWHRALAINRVQVSANPDSPLQKLGIFQRRNVTAMEDSGEIVDMIRREHINAVYGNVAYIEELADRIQERGGAGFKLQTLVPGAGHIDDNTRRYLRETFSPVRYAEFYGTTETGIIASRTHDFYQPDFNSVFFCLKDPVAEGPNLRGSILLTALHSFSQPILNLEIGDLVTVSGYTRHEELNSRIISIDGRDNDFLVLKDGQRLSAAFFYMIFERFDFLRQFQLVQERAGHCDIRLKIASEGDRQRLYKVTDMIRHFSRGRFDFDLHVVDHIATQPNGKRKILISRLTCKSGGSTPGG